MRRVLPHGGDFHFDEACRNPSCHRLRRRGTALLETYLPQMEFLVWARVRTQGRVISQVVRKCAYANWGSLPVLRRGSVGRDRWRGWQTLRWVRCYVWWRDARLRSLKSDSHQICWQVQQRQTHYAAATLNSLFGPYLFSETFFQVSCERSLYPFVAWSWLGKVRLI